VSLRVSALVMMTLVSRDVSFRDDVSRTRDDDDSSLCFLLPLSLSVSLVFFSSLSLLVFSLSCFVSSMMEYYCIDDVYY
jgi:hypothetical protein